MTTPDNAIDIIRNGFEEMAKNEIVIAPWMAMDEHGQRLTEAQRIEIRALAHELSTLYRNGQVIWSGTGELPQFFREHVYFETILSTASYLSYMRLGTLVITDEMILVANRLVHRYVAMDSGSALLSIYVRIMFYLSGQVLAYFGEVPEDVFLSGAWHRPWTERSLDFELEYALENDLMERREANGQAFIALTKRGNDLYLECARDLEECGYLKQREQLMRATNFTNMDDYEPMMERMNPIIRSNRESLVRQSGIGVGMHVLELGCGAGALTLDDGLYEAVGPSGSVVATDPSIGMLARGNKKLEKFHAPNVIFCQAAAERIPFPDSQFDAVIGMLFLHFTDIPKAFQEIRRVMKSGGAFTTMYGLNFSKRQDFFIEWFQPLFQSGLVIGNATALPDEETVPSIAGRYFENFTCESQELIFDFSHVETVVQFLVQGGTMAELSGLPWRARHELFTELVRRGYEVKEKYGAERMKLTDRVQVFRGVVTK